MRIPTLSYIIVFLMIAMCLSQFASGQDQLSTSLFNGTFEGWEGDTKDTWRIEDGAIVAGSMEKAAPRNEFLTTVTRFSDFELRLKFKTTGTKKINCGIQFRSERLSHRFPSKADDAHEVIGYQADIGENVHGFLYDESRRRKFLVAPNKEVIAKVTANIPEDGWQSYRIRAVGNRIQLWLNDVLTVDYTEEDQSIWKKGVIGLQIHGQMVGTVAYKDIFITDLAGSVESAASIEDFAWIAGHWSGEAMGGSFEETWNPPMGGEMLGMFKMVNNEKVSFYEILTIVPKGDSFVLRLKHFSPGLVGWEEKDEAEEFPLVSVSEKEACFEGLKFINDGQDKLTIEVMIGEGEKAKPVQFKGRRAK